MWDILTEIPTLASNVLKLPTQERGGTEDGGKRLDATDDTGGLVMAAAASQQQARFTHRGTTSTTHTRERLRQTSDLWPTPKQTFGFVKLQDTHTHTPNRVWWLFRGTGFKAKGEGIEKHIDW